MWHSLKRQWLSSPCVEGRLGRKRLPQNLDLHLLQGYPCPVHVLKTKHDDDLRATGNVTGHWFPDSSGCYCTKEGVVEPIRLAVLRSGGVAKGNAGSWLISRRAFRITGARALSAWGLDAVTIQLLGRWGSMAVLSYLAESPLVGFAERLQDTTFSSSSSNTSSPANLVDCVIAAPIRSST